jgi:hypothetical protein
MPCNLIMRQCKAARTLQFLFFITWNGMGARSGYLFYLPICWLRHRLSPLHGTCAMVGDTQPLAATAFQKWVCCMLLIIRLLM